MATKNLARTAVERGRVGPYKVERDREKASRRTRERAHARKALRDPDAVLRKVPRHGRWGQSENLKPLYRFLDKQIGRNWAKVYSEIRARFDIRTLQAFHIVVQHLMRDIDPHDAVEPYRSEYYLDKQNRLQHTKHRRYRYMHWWRRKGGARKDVLNWLNNRAIRLVGVDKYRWFYPAQKSTLKWVDDRLAFFQRKHRIETAFVQGPPLSDDDLTFLKAHLGERTRQQVLALCPAPPERHQIPMPE